MTTMLRTESFGDNVAWESFKKRIRSANAMVLNAERRYGKDSKLVQSIYKSIEQAYNSPEGSKRRFTAPPTGVKLQDIAKIDRALKRVETSRLMTKAGRESISKKSRETWQERNKDIDVRYFDMFIKAKEELGSLIYATSSHIINELNNSSYKLTKAEFNRILQDYKDDINSNIFIQKGEDNPQFFEYLYDKIKELEHEKMAKRGKKKFYGT